MKDSGRVKNVMSHEPWAVRSKPKAQSPKRRRLLTTYRLPLAIALCFSGCTFHSFALKSTVDLLIKGTAAVYEESDLQFAEESIASQLKALEVLLKNDPTHPELVLLTAQGFGAYAFLFLEEKDPERAKNFYERGKNYGLRFLERKTVPNLSGLEILDFTKALEKIKVKDIPILFWTAYCWGGVANLSRNDPMTLAELPKIERMMLRVNELLPGYFYSGADIFLGSYYGSRPKMLGGDLDKSKFYFERALAVSDAKFLMTLVLFAKSYAVATQQKELFQNLLNKTLEFPLQSFPEQRLSNTVAKMRAQKLLEEIDEYF